MKKRLLTGILILYSIYIFNDGEIRLFMFLGIFLGVLSYILTISKPIISFFVYISNFIKKILGTIINLFLVPIKFLIKIFKKIFFKPTNFIIINLKKLFHTNVINNKISKSLTFFSKKK